MIKVKGNRKQLGYFHMDMKRAFCSGKIVIGIIGIAIMLFFGCKDEIMEYATVLYLYWRSIYGIQYIFAMIFCTYPYARSFCEDIECGYIKQLFLKGNLKEYCVSKVVVIACSAVGTMLGGSLLFVCILRTNIPWINVRESVYLSATKNGSFHDLLLSGHYGLYFFMFAIQAGLLMVVLALFSSLISLYVRNQLLTLAIPVIVYYFLSHMMDKVFGGIKFMNLNTIYGGAQRIVESDILSFLYAVVWTGCISVGVTYGIYTKLRKEMQNG